MGFFVMGPVCGAQRKEEKAMATRLNVRRIGNLLWITRHPVKLTALLYLREALLEERYEDCAQMIAIAQEFGAAPVEIKFLLEDARRLPKW